jgi:hypothetical protein
MDKSIIAWAESTTPNSWLGATLWHLMDNSKTGAYCDIKTKIKIETARDDLPAGSRHCQRCINYVQARNDIARARALGQGVSPNADKS